jgi:hypothetical protein
MGSNHQSLTPIKNTTPTNYMAISSYKKIQNSTFLNPLSDSKQKLGLMKLCETLRQRPKILDFSQKIERSPIAQGKENNF